MFITVSQHRALNTSLDRIFETIKKLKNCFLIKVSLKITFKSMVDSDNRNCAVFYN